MTQELILAIISLLMLLAFTILIVALTAKDDSEPGCLSYIIFVFLCIWTYNKSSNYIATLPKATSTNTAKG